MEDSSNPFVVDTELLTINSKRLNIISVLNCNKKII